MSLVVWLIIVAAVSYGMGWAVVRLVAALWPRPASPVPARARESVDAAMRDAVLAPFREALEATRRPVARISLEAFPEDDPIASKVGGSAWWPVGESPPADAGGRPLVLLAQVNFAQVPPMPGYPTQGLLQFFIAPDDTYGINFDQSLTEAGLCEQRGFRVVFWQDLEAPGDPLPARSVGADDLTPHAPDQPRRMVFTPGSETISVNDHRFDRLLGGDSFAAFRARAEALGHAGPGAEDVAYELMNHLDAPGHKLGGYPTFTQTDPRGSDRFELLLQLDSDDAMMWGDAGVAGFFIAPGDLARADFSRVMYHWDCC